MRMISFLSVLTVGALLLARLSCHADELTADRAAWLTQRFEQLDVNHDKQLSQAELGQRLFLFLNSNHDDGVTLEEAREVVRAEGFEALQKVANGQILTTSKPKDDSSATLNPVRQGPQRLVPGDHGVGRFVADLPLQDLDGKLFKLADYHGKKAVVIAFTNTSCPVCKKYTPTLAAIEKQYANDGVAFIFVNPTSSDKLDAIKNTLAEHQLSGRYVRDEDHQLARALGATHTTDCFLLDAKRTVVYRGAVDDQYGFGYSIDEPRTKYLCDAIDRTLAGKSVEIAATEAPGCPLDLEAGTDAVDGDITYHNRISRIMQTHCISCHREGGVAPFALDNYAAVADQSGSIRRVVNDDVMPPWFAAKQKDGKPSPFLNDCSLSKKDKESVLTWLASKKPAGNPEDAPLPRVFSSAWQIGEPDLILAIPQPIAVKASGTMPYQNVVIETGFTADRYVKALQVKPTAREVVHHCLVFVLPPAKGNAKDRDERAGDSESDGFFAAYAPGYDGLVFNPGFGKIIPAGSRLKFQIHYTPNGTATRDQTEIGMIFAEEAPEHLLNVAAIAQPRLAIPPHAENHEVTASIKLSSDATILAYFPHMHLRGKAFRYEAILPDGKTQMLLDIPRYDFNWQLSYRLAEPLKLPAGTTVRATAWFDNSKNNPANPDPNRTVPWGQQTYDEMMIGYVEYYMEGAKIDRLASLPAVAALRNLGDGAALESMFKKLDRNQDQQLSKDELPQEQGARLMRLDTDGDGLISLPEAKRLSQLLKRNES